MALIDYCTHYGIRPQQFPKISGQYRGQRIVVCGDASCIWDDLERFGCRKNNGVAKDGWDFMTVNGLVSVFPGIVHHAYSNHSGVLDRWVRARRDDYTGQFGPPLACHSCIGEPQFKWPWHGSGTSGLGAVCTALALGYGEVIIAGMPLDSSPHNGEPHWRKTNVGKEVSAEGGTDMGWKLVWRSSSTDYPALIRSMSGRTKEWFGSPV